VITFIDNAKARGETAQNATQNLNCFACFVSGFANNTPKASFEFAKNHALVAP
jgi:hypothetical protein